MQVFRTTIILALALFLFDAFFLNQGFVSILVVLFTFVVLFPGLCGHITEIDASAAYGWRRLEFISWQQ